MRRQLLSHQLLSHFLISVIFCCSALNSLAFDTPMITPENLPVAMSEPANSPESMPENTKAPEVADKKSPLVEPAALATKTMEQSLYESNLRLSVVKYGILKDNWALKFPRQALKANKAFNKEESGILTISTQTLLSLNAPLNEYDFPEMYALWVENIDLIDAAQSAGFYTPPTDLANALAAWRMKKQIDQATLEAAWVLGPSFVEIDTNVAPIQIPAGFKFLHIADLHNLNNKIYEIKRTAVENYKLKFSLPASSETISHLIAPTDLDQKWTASITMINNRLVTFENAFKNDEMLNSAAMLETVKFRQDPTTNMRFGLGDMGSYNKNLVRWLIVPKRDVQKQTLQYAMTDGAATKALGLAYAHLTLGKNQQVIVTLNHLSVAQSLAFADYLPAGKQHADYLPENVLKPVLASIKPLLQSIQFKPGFQLKDAIDADKKMQVQLASLIEGQPTIMEQGIKRMMAEDARKSNFWLFLKDHPRYQGSLLAALGVLLAAFSKVYNTKKPDGFVINYPFLSSFIVLFLPIIMMAGLIYINFFAE